MKEKLKPFLNIIYPLIALSVIFLIWLIAEKVVGAELIIPSISSTFSSLGRIFADGEFWLSVGGSLFRAVRSFVYGALLAITFSLLSYLFVPVRKVLDPLISILRSTPTMAIILVVVLWLGSRTAPVIIAFLITFPLLYANFLAGFDAIDGKLLEMAKIYKVRKRDVIKDLFLPSIAPFAFDGMKSAISLSLKVTIASEVMAQTIDSLGLYMQTARVNLETADLIACTIVAIVLSYALELVVSLIKKLVVRW